MRKKYVALGLLLTPLLALSQISNKTYIGISSDSLVAMHYLEFIDDSSLYLKSIPDYPNHSFSIASTHANRPLNIPFHYIKDGGKLLLRSKCTLYPDERKYMGEKIGFSDSVILQIDGKALLNRQGRIAYMQKQDYENSPLMQVFLEGKIYSFKKPSSKSRALKKKVGKMDLSLYSLVLYKGLEAFEHHGYDAISGIIECKKKE
ncbi:MAG: hypothetical protein AAF696_26710 [Bacteroidota bacterium]